MDIKEKSRKPSRVLIIDDMSDVPAGLYDTPPDAGSPGLIKPSAIAAAAALARELAPAPKGTDENTVWPDGKPRPYMVKVKGGAAVWLTQEEHDALILSARHRARANPQGPRQQPKAELAAGDTVFLYGLDTKGYWRCSVDRVKADGRIRVGFDGLGHEDLPPVGSPLTVVKDELKENEGIPVYNFIVTSSWKRGAHLRLATPADLQTPAPIEDVLGIELEPWQREILDRVEREKPHCLICGSTVIHNHDVDLTKPIDRIEINQRAESDLPILTSSQIARRIRKENRRVGLERKRLAAKFQPVAAPIQELA